VDARKDYCWGSPVYVYAEILNRAFAEYGWCSAIRGPHATIGDLPTHNLPGGDPATQVGPTNIVYDDSVEYQFDQLGFIAFCKELNSTKAVFPGGHSCNSVAKYSTDDAQASAELSARLPNVFARSRFAHAIKVMCRDKVGDFADEESVRTELSNWLSQYKLDNPSAATSEQKARRPLLGYNVVVRQVEGQPGVFEASIDLSLHHQIEEIGVTMSLVAEVSASKEP
jgi:type VI secretion system protein ImpC